MKGCWAGNCSQPSRSWYAGWSRTGSRGRRRPGCASLSSGLFNQTDASRIERSYYQQLIDAGRRLDDLGDLPALRGQRRAGNTFSAPVHSAPLVMGVDDLREVILKPSDSVTKWGIAWRTNAQGMRDRSYPIEKAAGTFRIALVGDSIGAGWGVNVDQRFESILERDWDDRSRRSGGPAVEILNCAVPGHSPGQRWYHFEQIGWPMRPDLVICEATEADDGWDERRLRYVLSRGHGLDSPIYRDVLDSAGVAGHWEPEQYKRILQPRHREILVGVYRTMAAECRARGIPIVWVLIPRVGRPSDASVHRFLLESARSAAFDRVVNATDAYDGLEAVRLAVEPNDFHPNPEGHARLARRLDAALGELPELQPIRGRGRDEDAGRESGQVLHRSPRGAEPR